MLRFGSCSQEPELVRVFLFFKEAEAIIVLFLNRQAPAQEAKD